MRIEIAESARRHGIADERIRFVIDHAGLAFDQPAPEGSPGEDRLVFLGDDEHGVALELVAVTNRADDLRVIHAMKMRKRKYQKHYEEALRWRVSGSS